MQQNSVCLAEYSKNKAETLFEKITYWVSFVFCFVVLVIFSAIFIFISPILLLSALVVGVFILLKYCAIGLFILLMAYPAWILLVNFYRAFFH